MLNRKSLPESSQAGCEHYRPHSTRDSWLFIYCRTWATRHSFSSWVALGYGKRKSRKQTHPRMLSGQKDKDGEHMSNF